MKLFHIVVLALTLIPWAQSFAGIDSGFTCSNKYFDMIMEPKGESPDFSLSGFVVKANPDELHPSFGFVVRNFKTFPGPAETIDCKLVVQEFNRLQIEFDKIINLKRELLNEQLIVLEYLLKDARCEYCYHRNNEIMIKLARLKEIELGIVPL